MSGSEMSLMSMVIRSRGWIKGMGRVIILLLRILMVCINFHPLCLLVATCVLIQGYTRIKKQYIDIDSDIMNIGDGDEECLVALFGPNPGKGVYYYKAIDLDRGIFAKWKVANESAARIAIGYVLNYTGPLFFPLPSLLVYFTDT